ncbi:MAG: hypothetical protein QXY40_04890 [Candidatus Methanomethylicia archaeon]
MQNYLDKVSKLKSFFSKIKDAIILLGGDIGSAVLAKIAKDSLGDNVIAITINSPIVSPLRIYNASKLATQIKISHILVNLNELQIENFARNSKSNRCLLCVTYRYGMIKKIALEAGFSKIIDGSYIQGSIFEQKRNICIKEDISQPFIELGFNHDEVLKLHKFIGLKGPQHIPKCIANKIPYNTEITLDKIKYIRLIEAYLHKRYKVYADVHYNGESIILDVKATTSCDISKSEIINSITKTFRNANIKKIEWTLPSYTL